MSETRAEICDDQQWRMFMYECSDQNGRGQRGTTQWTGLQSKVCGQLFLFVWKSTESDHLFDVRLATEVPPW